MSLFFLGLKDELLRLHASFEARSQKQSGPKITNEGNVGMEKIAFDTRRINSEMQFNPRRNLQNYQRSEPFIGNDISDKIKNLFKVKLAVDLIKDQFMGDPDWLDSNSRILCNAVDNALRIEQKDYDFFKPQFDYLDELLYLRYRLASDDINKLQEKEIKEILLKKDEKLMYKSIYANYNRPEKLQSNGNTDNDSLMNKLFSNVKATKDNKSVERSINIIIKDSILDDKEMVKKTSENLE